MAVACWCAQGQSWAAISDVDDVISLNIASSAYVSVTIYSSTLSDLAGLTRWSIHLASTSATVPGGVRERSEHWASTPATTPCWERLCAAIAVVSRKRLRRRAVSPPDYVRWICFTATSNEVTTTSGNSMTSSSTRVAVAEANVLRYSQHAIMITSFETGDNSAWT